MEDPVKKRKGLPVWAAILVGAAAIVLTLVMGILLLRSELSGKDGDTQGIAQATAEPTPIGQTTPETADTPAPGSTAKAEPTEIPTEEPAPAVTPEATEEPTEEPTEAPTEAPTPKPTETPKPTPKPDSFKFGGVKIPSGTKKINGSKLGINGKSSKLRHITAEEVENLVALCPDLEELILDYCYMDDYEPLGGLVKLKTLRLRRCNENGKGNPVTDIGWVANLTSLTNLQLGHNSISDLRPLANLKKLTKLNLSYNDLEDADLDALSDLTALQELSLYGLSKITDVAPLASLTKLTFLHLGYNKKLNNVKILTSLPKLTSLRVNKTNISDVSYFKNFKALKQLDISGCPILFHNYYALEDCKELKLIVLDPKDTDASLAIDDMINNGFGVEILYEWP